MAQPWASQSPGEVPEDSLDRGALGDRQELSSLNLPALGRAQSLSPGHFFICRSPYPRTAKMAVVFGQNFQFLGKTTCVIARRNIPSGLILRLIRIRLKLFRLGLKIDGTEFGSALQQSFG